MRRGVWIGVVLVGCAPAVAGPAPAAPPSPPSTASAPNAPSPPAAGGVIDRSSVSPPPLAAPSPAREAVVRVEIERPFRLDLRVVAKGRDAFLAELHERERWNKGELGELSQPLPPVPGHPAPKVIVDVLSVRGPHKTADVQREARRLFWMKILHCYGLGAYRDQKLRGKARLSFKVDRAGKVFSSKVTSSTIEDDDVSKCLAEEMKKVPLTKARAGSTVTAEVQIGPGDEPMPPPPSAITPGDGTIDPAAIQDVVRGAMPAFEACYRPALAYAPHLWGRLGLRFHQTDKGKLDEVFEAETLFPDERVTLCALKVARGLSLPKPTGGEVRFVVGLRFSAGETP